MKRAIKIKSALFFSKIGALDLTIQGDKIRNFEGA